MSIFDLRKHLLLHEELYNNDQIEYYSPKTQRSTAVEFTLRNLLLESHVILSYIYYMKEAEPELNFNLSHIISKLELNPYVNKDDNHTGIIDIKVQEDERIEIVYNIHEDELFKVIHMRDAGHQIDNPFKEFEIRNDNINISLDYVLAHYKPFKELSTKIKQRIVNLEFINKQIKEEIFVDTNLTAIKNSLIEARKEGLNEENREIAHRLKRLDDELIELQKRYNNNVLMMSGFENIGLDEEKLKRVLSDPRIQSIQIGIRNKKLQLFTNPIYLSFDENKKDSNTHTRKLKNGERLCIGRHLIEINLNNLSIQFNELNEGLKNSHVENYTCYGNFAEHISNARKNNDLPRLISLSLQMISHATIGDPAGNETLRNAIIVDKKESVTIGKEEMHINIYLDRIKNNKALSLEILRGREEVNE